MSNTATATTAHIQVGTDVVGDESIMRGIVVVVVAARGDNDDTVDVDEVVVAVNCDVVADVSSDDDDIFEGVVDNDDDEDVVLSVNGNDDDDDNNVAVGRIDDDDNVVFGVTDDGDDCMVVDTTLLDVRVISSPNAHIRGNNCREQHEKSHHHVLQIQCASTNLFGIWQWRIIWHTVVTATTRFALSKISEKRQVNDILE
jgi:hypothetical protein